MRRERESGMLRECQSGFWDRSVWPRRREPWSRERSGREAVRARCIIRAEREREKGKGEGNFLCRGMEKTGAEVALRCL